MYRHPMPLYVPLRAEWISAPASAKSLHLCSPGWVGKTQCLKHLLTLIESIYFTIGTCLALDSIHPTYILIEESEISGLIFF